MPAEPAPAPSIESLFLLWRDSGDDGALAEVLALTEEELFAVARRQARDDSAAWDLVQESLRTVLRESHRWDEQQRLMPWLVGIIQIEARRARRDAARTPDPARLDAPIARSVESEVSESEVRTLVVHGVTQLPDTYRDVVSMHLLDGLSHAEIASRTGREPGTVRVQVFRGLAQLRKLMPASLALGSALAILAPTSSAARAATMLDGAAQLRPGAATTTAATATSASVGGGLFAGSLLTWVVGASAAALVVAAVWLRTRASDDTSSAGNVASVATPPAATGATRSGADPLTPVEGRTQRTAVASTVVANTPAKPAIAPLGVRLVGTVAGLATLLPGAPTLSVRADGVAPLVAAIDALDHFDIDLSAWYAPEGPAPREFVVEYDHPNAMPTHQPVLLDASGLIAARAAADASVRRPIEVAFALQAPAARVHGVATWEAALAAHQHEFEPGTTARFAALFAFDATGALIADPVEAAAVNADGTFWLRTPRTGRHALVVTPWTGDIRPASLTVDLVAGADLDVGAIEVGSGARLSGTVLFVPGRPTSGIEPVVRWRNLQSGRVHSVYGTPLLWTDSTFERPAGEATVEQNGTFTIGGLAPGEFELASAWRARADAVVLDVTHASGPLTLVSAPDLDVVLPSPRAAPILTVRAAGIAAAGATVAYTSAAGERTAVLTDASGRVHLVGVDTGVVRIELAGYDSIEFSLADPAPASIDIDLVPSGAFGSIALVGAGIDWTQAACTLVLASTVDAEELALLQNGGSPTDVVMQRAVAAADGTLAEAIPAGRWWLQIRARREAVDGPLAHARPFVADVEVLPGVATRVDVALELAGRLRIAPIAAPAEAASAAREVELELVGPSGARKPLEITSLVLRGDARQGRVTTTDRMPFGANGTSALLEPGTYAITARCGAGPVLRTVTITAGRTTTVDFGDQ